MKKVLILLLSLIQGSCMAQEATPAKPELPSPLSYKSLTVPVYFDSLANHYSDQLFAIDSAEYFLFCSENKLLATHKQNQRTWVRIILLHRMFTASTAANG